MSPPPAEDAHEDGRWRGRMEEKVDQLGVTLREERDLAGRVRHDVRNSLHLQDGLLAELKREVTTIKDEIVPIVKTLRDDKIRAGGMIVVLAVIGSAIASLAVGLAGKLIDMLF